MSGRISTYLSVQKREHVLQSLDLTGQQGTRVVSTLKVGVVLRGGGTVNLLETFALEARQVEVGRGGAVQGRGKGGSWEAWWG